MCLPVTVVIWLNRDKLDDDKEFEVIGNIDDVKPNIGSEKNGITGGQNTDQKDEGLLLFIRYVHRNCC